MTADFQMHRLLLVAGHTHTPLQALQPTSFPASLLDKAQEFSR